MGHVKGTAVVMMYMYMIPTFIVLAFQPAMDEEQFGEFWILCLPMWRCKLDARSLLPGQDVHLQTFRL